MNIFNQAICDLGKIGGVDRCGEFSLQNGLIHINHDKPHMYAMFQHGDQATYKMNQHLENKANNKGDKKAVILGAVNEESNERLAWCVRGVWYVTKDLNEHRDFRAKLGIIAPIHWSNIILKKIGLTYKIVK